MGWEKFIEVTASLVAAFIFGAVVSALQLRKRFEEFERVTVAPLRDKLEKLQKESSVFVTREELHQAVNSLRHDLKEWIDELRSDIRALRGAK